MPSNYGVFASLVQVDHGACSRSQVAEGSREPRGRYVLEGEQHHQGERVDRRLDEAVMLVEGLCVLVVGMDEDKSHPDLL
jgi:hypothetical protein